MESQNTVPSEQEQVFQWLVEEDQALGAAINGEGHDDLRGQRRNPAYESSITTDYGSSRSSLDELFGLALDNAASGEGDDSYLETRGPSSRAAAADADFSAEVEETGAVMQGEGLTVSFNKPVADESAQSGLAIVPHQPGDVHVSPDGTRVTWVPVGSLPEGQYTLVVEGLTDVSGYVPFPRREIPFTVEAAGMRPPSLPDRHELLHRAENQLPVTRKRIQILKVLDPGSGRQYEMAADHRGQPVDLNRLLGREARAAIARYKKMHPALFQRVQRLRGSESLPIALWIYVNEDEVDKGRYVDPRGTEPLLLASQEDDETATRAASPIDRPPSPLLAYRQQVRAAKDGLRPILQERIGLRVTAELASVPVMVVQATKRQLQRLARLPQISGLFLYETDGVLDLDDSMTVSRADQAVNTLGWKGTNIRVGVWEPGPDVLTNLRVVEHFDSARTDKSSHARLVSGIIKNRESGKPHGYAPDSRVYSANNYTLEALEWAVTRKECTVINQSFHHQAEAQNGSQSLDDRVKDYLATHYPFPTIVHAAGNYWATDSDGITPPSNEYVNHKGFNTLAVGNHNDAASAMSGSSVFRNPTSAHGDRELPEVSANGTGVTAVGLTMSGTSFASPAVAGVVALLQNANNSLIRWPEGNRAILMASAGRNVSGRSWWRDVNTKTDGSDGAGAVDAEEAVRTAGSRKRRNNTAALRGWDVGTLKSRDIQPDKFANFVYRVSVPSTGPRRRVKVALAWNSKTKYSSFALFGTTHRSAESKLTVDLDLQVFDGATRVAHSSSFDNSYEIVEFTGQPGKTYTIKIRRHSGTDWTYYGVAWTVHTP